MKRRLPLWQRLLAVGAGLALIDPGLITDICGIVVIAFIVFLQYVVKDKKSTELGETG
jgi:UPF0716 family protein affecting phage T7 exclusion